MPFAASLSTNSQTSDALDEICNALRDQVPSPDLALIFFTPHHAGDAEMLAIRLLPDHGRQVIELPVAGGEIRRVMVRSNVGEVFAGALE